MDSGKPSNRENEQTVGTSRLETRESDQPLEGRPESPDLIEGRSLGPYRLIRRLGRGGFGEVWEAEAAPTGRKLAIKVLTQVPALPSNIIDRFQQEGRLAASINHPNCVYIFGAEEMDGYPVITMELMPGGTLQDLLNRGEEISITQAVDYALRLIDGLEAAQQAGIIHRDIKPSNCFLDENGNIKIGDFGLSKTLESDTKLTVTGTFLGTPSYASPEQVRGQNLDFRTDLYSLSATLYALIAGSPPFEGKHAAEVLARIAADPPPSLRQKRKDVHPGLEKAILRALAKNPEKRPSGYKAFRAALIPYSSIGLKISGLGKRYFAYLVDSSIIISLILAGGLLTRKAFPEFSLYDPVFSFVYFLLFDRLWGRTPGKQLFGLRVVSNAGTPLSWKSAFFRTLLFVVLTSVLQFSKVIIPFGESSELSLNPGWFAVIATMRRRNSFAGLHEMLSQTRVMAMPAAEQITVPDLRPAFMGQVSETFGPYRARAILWESEDEKLYAGYDEILKREVWIRSYAKQDQALPARELTALRNGRLRWIQGSRDPEKHWDVFEFPTGAGLRLWLETHGKLSWPQMRTVMESTATELEAQIAENKLSREISVDHLWIDRFGNTKILDFPVSKSTEPGTTTVARWRDFLHQLLLFGLTGKIVPLEVVHKKVPEVPLPESSRDFIQKLCCGNDFDSPKSVSLALANLAGRRAEVGRWRRFATLSVPFSPIVFLLLVVLQIVLTMPQWMMDMAYASDHLKTLSGLSQTAARDSQARSQALQKVLAYCYSEYLKVDLSRSTYRLQLEESEKRQLEAIVRKYPIVSYEQYQEARSAANLKGDLFTVLMEQIPDNRPWHTYIFAVVRGISFLAFLMIPVTFVLRRPLMLALLGISLQTKKGQRIGRFRAAFRSLVSWLPILLFAPQPPLANYFYFGLLAVTLAGMIYSILYPTRGIQDRIAGTVLVPS